MNLLQALNLDDPGTGLPPCLAYVGAGGKTGAMFHLARLLLKENQYRTVLVSTTTHLGIQELAKADLAYMIDEEQDWHSLDEHQADGLVLVSGPTLPNDRVSSLPDKMLERLFLLAKKWGVPLLLEADGSRRRPVKAPADHEPVIPDFVTGVVVVAGLSALGNILDEAIVHRPELFSELSGISLGEVITPEGLMKVLTHHRGGLKDIPLHVDRWLLLNQVEFLDDLYSIEPYVDEALAAYPQVILASIQKQKIFGVYERIAGVILAAGASERFGSIKQLALWRGQTLLSHVIQKSLASGLSPVRVITGANSEQILNSLKSLPESTRTQIEIVHNPEWNSGLSTSVRAGIDVLPAAVHGVVFLLSDQPQIPVDLIRGLRRMRAQERSWAVVPRYRGQRVNPVLFGKELFSELMALQGDSGGRQLLHEPISFPITWLDWEESYPRLDLDIDRPEDLQVLKDLDSA